MNRSKQEVLDAKDRLLESVKAGDTVFCILRHRSRSGMSRVIQLVVFKDDGKYGIQPRWLGYNAAIAMGWRYDEKNEGVRIGGCGMDMGFHAVYSLSRVLFPNGAKTDHSSSQRDGGYALRHRWL